MAKECEHVTVLIYNRQSFVNAFTVPAYTRAPDDFDARVETLKNEYLRLSETNGEALSLGDFVLWLVAQASSEPLIQ